MKMQQDLFKHHCYEQRNFCLTHSPRKALGLPTAKQTSAGRQQAAGSPAPKLGDAALTKDTPKQLHPR